MFLHNAGTAATAYQSAHGATALFSTFQSAAMGGYGVAAVNGVISIGAAISAAGAGVLQWLQNGGGNGTQGFA